MEPIIAYIKSKQSTIREDLKQIKGEDNKVNSKEEAEAIFQYMKKANIKGEDDAILLYTAYQQARTYMINGGQPFLLSCLKKGYAYCKKVGSEYLTKAKNYIENLDKSTAKTK